MKLALVVPCYNEEEALPKTARVLLDKLTRWAENGTVSADSRIFFVNDGSTDGTWACIAALHERDASVCGIGLSRNEGHQNALMAGLDTVRDRFDAAVTLDADLQDDVDAIDEMLAQYRAGCDVVLGVRASRKSDTAFKRATAHGFYRLMRHMGVELVSDHADFRLMSRRALQALSGFTEVNLFLRGLVPLVGFPTGTVYYERRPRTQGRTKYPLSKMLHFAFEGITSMSVRPIRLIAALGCAIFAVSLLILLYSLLRYLTGHTVSGWTSLSLSIWGLGGLQLLALGVIGEYIGKIYLEVKHRPRYIIAQTLDDTAERGER